MRVTPVEPTYLGQQCPSLKPSHPGSNADPIESALPRRGPASSFVGSDMSLLGGAVIRISRATDLRQHPLKLYEGFEDATLHFDPSAVGHLGFPPFDLLLARLRLVTPEVEVLVGSVGSFRVTVPATQSAKAHSAMAFAAASQPSATGTFLLVLFTFFEASAGHYVGFVHHILELTDGNTTA